MAELGRDIVRLVNLAYPQADVATRETLSINAFLDALLGPAIETRLHVIKGRPRTLQEVVAYATVIDAVLQAKFPQLYKLHLMHRLKAKHGKRSIKAVDSLSVFVDQIPG